MTMDDKIGSLSRAILVGMTSVLSLTVLAVLAYPHLTNQVMPEDVIAVADRTEAKVDTLQEEIDLIKVDYQARLEVSRQQLSDIKQQLKEKDTDDRFKGEDMVEIAELNDLELPAKWQD
jgi:hypothetical protein